MQTPPTLPTRTRRHRSRGALSVRLAAPIGTALVGALVVVGVGAHLSGGKDNECSGQQSTVQLAAAPEIAPVVAEAARALAAGSQTSCDQVVVSARLAASVAIGLRSAKAARPDVWVPDSSVWLSRVPVPGLRPAGAVASIATSPTVLAVSDTTATRMGWPGRVVGFDRLTASGDHPAPVRFTGLDPRTSATGTGVLLGLQSTLAGRSDATAAFTATLQAAVPGATTPSQDLRAVAVSGDSTAFATSEQAVFAYDTTAPPSRQIVAAYPKRTAGALDYPMVVLRSDARTQATAGRLLAVLRSSQGQALVQSQGFRSVEGAPGRELTLESGVDWRVNAKALPGTSRAVTQLLERYQALTEPARMLAVVDVSGSMGEIVPGTGGASRMDLTRAAAAEALGLFPDTTMVGLWEFSTNLTPTTDYRQILPIGPASGAGREAMAVALAGLREVPDGGTGLYDTVRAAVQQMRKDWDPNRANTVVVLTDGRNDDQNGIDLPTLLQTLRRENDPKRPVQVIAVVFGPDGDAAALGAITDATGGSTYVARDPRQVRALFLDAVSRHS